MQLGANRVLDELALAHVKLRRFDLHGAVQIFGQVDLDGDSRFWICYVCHKVLIGCYVIDVMGVKT